MRPAGAPNPVDAEGCGVEVLAETGAVSRSRDNPPISSRPGAVLGPRSARIAYRRGAGDERLIIEDDYDSEYRYDRVR